MTTSIDLDATAVAWLQAAQAAATEIARLSEIKERAIDHVKQAMGDAEQALINGQPVVTWAWSKPGQRLDRKKLEGDLGPELVAKYLVDNQPARPFKIVLAPE